MKRILLCVLCLCLLFSLGGCGMLQPADKTGMVNEDSAASAEPAANEPVADAPLETETPAEAAREWNGAIFTDYSAYEPHDGAANARFTRLREEFIDSLAPGDYGEFFPFAADELNSAGGDEGYSYSMGNYYGFVTNEGQIICDPVYTSVSQLVCYHYSTSQAVPLPLWSMSRTTDTHTVTEGEYSWLEGDTLYAVAAMDGSFVTPMKYRDITPFENGFLATESSYYYDSDVKPSFEVFDLQGNRLFGASDIPVLSGSEGGSFNLAYSDGVYILSFYPEGRNVCYALDETGSVLFGPMQYIGSFCSGLAPATEDGTLYGYVDTQGNWLISPRFTSAEAFYDGLALCADGDDPVVIDTHGVERITEHSGWMYRSGDYFIFNSDDQMQRIYDNTGALLLRGNYGEYWNWLEDDVFYFSNGDNTVTLRHLDSGEEQRFPGVSWFQTMDSFDPYGSGSGKASIFYEGKPCYIGCGWSEEADVSSYTFIGKDFSVLAVRNDVDFHLFADQITGESYLGIGNNRGGYPNSWEIFDAEGNSHGTYIGQITLYGGWVQVTDRFTARLYRPDGTLVFCYPLLSVLDD